MTSAYPPSSPSPSYLRAGAVAEPSVDIVGTVETDIGAVLAELQKFLALLGGFKGDIDAGLNTLTSILQGAEKIPPVLLNLVIPGGSADLQTAVNVIAALKKAIDSLP